MRYFFISLTELSLTMTLFFYHLGNNHHQRHHDDEGILQREAVRMDWVDLDTGSGTRTPDPAKLDRPTERPTDPRRKRGK